MQSNADPSSGHCLDVGMCPNLVACFDAGVNAGFSRYFDDDACKRLRRCQVASSVAYLTGSLRVGSSRCRRRSGRGCLEASPKINGTEGGTGSVPTSRGVHGQARRRDGRVEFFLVSRSPGQYVYRLANPMPDRFPRGTTGAFMGQDLRGPGSAYAGTGVCQWTVLRAAPQVCGMSGRHVRGAVRQKVTWLGGLAASLLARQVISTRGGGVARRCEGFLGHPLSGLMGSSVSGMGVGRQRRASAGLRAGFVACRFSRRPHHPVAYSMAGGPVGGMAGRYA